MINYLQTVTVFGLRTDLQRAAADQQKIQAIRSDGDSAFDVERVRAIKELEKSVAMDEDRLEERKHGIRTPQQEETYLYAVHDLRAIKQPVPITWETRFRHQPQLSSGHVDILA